MNCSPSAWPWSGARGQAPGPERVRCSSRTKPQGDRRHFTRGSGQHRCWRCGHRDHLSGTRSSASSKCSTPSCRRWRKSMTFQFKVEVFKASAGGVHLTRASSVPFASAWCGVFCTRASGGPDRQHQSKSFSRQHQPCFQHQCLWWSLLHPRQQ